MSLVKDPRNLEVQSPRPEPRRDAKGGLRDEKGHFLAVPPYARKAWEPGVSANPTGAGGEYHKAIKLAREKSTAVVHRMIELAELNNIDKKGNLSPLSNRRTDARVAAMASQWLWECAWGKNRSPKIVEDAPGVTIEQRRDEAMATLTAAFERVLQASRKQAAAEAEDGLKYGCATQRAALLSSKINQLVTDVGG